MHSTTAARFSLRLEKGLNDALLKWGDEDGLDKQKIIERELGMAVYHHQKNKQNENNQANG